MSKTTGWIVVIVVILALGGLMYYMNANNSSTTSDSTDTSNVDTTSAQGRVIFSVTDAAVNMSTISEINMKINSVEMHSAANGWVSVSTSPQIYNLLDLNAKNEDKLLANLGVAPGVYDQIRLSIDSIGIKTKAGAVKDAKLPSGDLKINTMLVVNSDETSTVNIDFLADKSLHITGNGEYIFAPVVNTETRSHAAATVSATGVVSITGGNVDNNNTVGMDIDGTVKINFQIDASKKLELDSNNAIRINGLLK